MRWTRGGRSSNLEDRRGQSGGGFRGGGKLGLGGVVILLLLSVVFKQDFTALVGGAGALGGGVESGPATPLNDPAEEEMVEFVSFVLDDAQQVWAQLFAESGSQYPPAQLVLFREGVNSACGTASSATGPFYCPGDNKVYIDLGFFDDLDRQFGAPGDFAQAYVLAHEIGHHVQAVVGTDEQMRRAQQRDPGQANALSVRLELQADCLAGVWGYYAAQRNLLERADKEEGLRAAAAIGDDRLQRQAGGSV
ncbi:MAG: neutral zinc metallopeptidase, partial [Gemmatimonadales bacterium]|nr:neutral zinc metallopeptidase [Gemmatimonadales bacterium]